ncbi:hypothetical protein Gotri_025433, partial [Gossypium trilobum]|nr:hypothetical protein [Gossypium trilobum]
MVRFWDPAYQCFTFNQEDMTPTIEEYVALLRIDNVQLNKIYVNEPKLMTFKKKLMKLTGMADTWAEKQIKKKNEISCVPWFSLWELVQNHPDISKRINLLTLAVYGLIVFPKTLRSLNNCRKKGEGHFIGCAQLLNVWIFSHFWKVERTPFHMFSKTFAPLEAHLEKNWPMDVTEQHWFVSRQFVPVTDGYAHSEFAFMGEGYMKRSQLTLLINDACRNPFSKEMPSELEIARQEFEHEKAKLLRDISSLQEENYQLNIDVEIEKSRAEKVQKEVEVMRKYLRDLHLENKK